MNISNKLFFAKKDSSQKKFVNKILSEDKTLNFEMKKR